MENRKKVLLIIMDGWAHGPKTAANAVYKANTPFIDSLYKKFPNAELITCGEDVGLPEGQMGNSEVGHLNIGAGRIVYQELLRINIAVRDRKLEQNQVLQDALQYAKENNKPVHLIGLVSDGGVHSHINHLKALCDIAKNEGLEKVFIHAFTDGRDVDPKSGKGFIKDLKNHLKSSAGEIASIVGRYYAMDRDKRWERVKQAYDLMVKGEGKPTTDLAQAIQESYDEGVTDEFIKPIVKIGSNGKPVSHIEKGDVIICFNFRTDRCREIIMALTQQPFPEQNMQPLELYTVTMTRYDETFKDVKVIFETSNLENTLGEVLAKNGKTQLRIAETEKYPHVTFFFSGGREDVFDGEHRIMKNSPAVATYDLKPEMSAYEVTEAVIKDIEQEKPDFICLNFANADMVGHTGVFEAGVKAVETVDGCVAKIAEVALGNNYALLITADHGNADFMVNEDGSPNTAHTKFPVPIFYLNPDDRRHIKNGILADIAPTVLDILGIHQPEEMSGKSLLV